MSITITTRFERRIEANPRVLTIIETIRGDMIQAALTPDEARQIAAALTADQGGQWTRNDLPSEDDFQWEMFESRFGQFDGYRSPAKQHDLYTVFKSGIQYGQSRDLDHLNAHHPKPDPDTSAAAWKRMWDQASRARDAAVERAEQAEREASTWRTSTESAHSDFLQAAHDRDLWKDSAEYAAGERDEWMARAESAEARTAPAVSRADIEKAIRVRPWGTDGPDSQGYEILHVESAVDAVCDLFGVEAEQAVDPVEAEVAMAWAEYRKDYQPNPDDLTAAHKAFTSGYLAAHVLGQEADQ